MLRMLSAYWSIEVQVRGKVIRQLSILFYLPRISAPVEANMQGAPVEANMQVLTFNIHHGTQNPYAS